MAFTFIPIKLSGLEGLTWQTRQGEPVDFVANGDIADIDHMEKYGFFANSMNIPTLSGTSSVWVTPNDDNSRYMHISLGYDDTDGALRNIALTVADNPNNIGSVVFVHGIYDNIKGVRLIPSNLSLLKISVGSIEVYNRDVGEYVTIIECLVYARNIGDTKIMVHGFTTPLQNVLNTNNMNNISGDTFSPQYGHPSDGGGYGGGSFDDSSDTIPIPNKPVLGVSSTGFVNVYHTSLNALQNLGSELFPNIEDIINPPIGEAVADVLKETLFGINQSVSRIGSLITNSKLIDYIVDCHLLPVTPDSGTAEKIKIGFKQFEVQGNKVLNDYIDFDCGSLSIAEYYQNFIDYVGTRAKLYLPFVGFVPIPNEYFQGGTLSVKYRFNVIDGSFMAYVLATSSKSQLAETVIGSYGGNACVHIPITGSNYANMVSGLLNGTMGTLANAMGGNAVGTVSSALSVMSNRPDVQSRNGYNSTSAFLGVRRPYLIIEREVSNFSQTYTEEKGLPCNISKEIGSLSGFVQMGNIHMDTLTCTDTEKEMIRQLLEEGVIV